MPRSSDLKLLFPLSPAHQTNFIITFTWNFRTGPSVFIFELMLSATIIPRRRICGRLLSKWHFTPSIMLVRSSEKKKNTKKQQNSAWNNDRNKHSSLCRFPERASLAIHHTIMGRKIGRALTTMTPLSAMAVLPFSTNIINPCFFMRYKVNRTLQYILNLKYFGFRWN